MMDSEKAARELDEDCSVERVNLAIGGEAMKAKRDDAMRRAIPLSEKGLISPFANNFIGDLFRGREDGLTVEETCQRTIRLHSAVIAANVELAIEQLTKHDLLPPPVK